MSITFPRYILRGIHMHVYYLHVNEFPLFQSCIQEKHRCMCIIELRKNIFPFSNHHTFVQGHLKYSEEWGIDLGWFFFWLHEAKFKWLFSFEFENFFSNFSSIEWKIECISWVVFFSCLGKACSAWCICCLTNKNLLEVVN